MKYKKIICLLYLISSYAFSQTVSSVDSLDNYVGGTSVYLEGYYTPGDGGGGHFYKIDSSEPINGGTVLIDSTNFSKRWIRIIDDGKVNVKWFGAKGDGVCTSSNIDGTAIYDALTYAMAKNYNLYIPSGTYCVNNAFLLINTKIEITGDGRNSILKGTTSGGGFFVIDSNNVSISNLSFLVSDSDNYGRGIVIQNNSKNITLSKLHFTGNIANTISLFKCNDIKILNCNFEDVKGYQIVQEDGYPSSNVLVDSNYSNNCGADFVELNSEKATGSASKNWVITNNIVRNIGEGINHVECRFVGVTNTDGIIISNNIFDTCSGDSAFHFEGLTGNVVISNNTIKNPTKSSALHSGSLIFNVTGTTDSFGMYAKDKMILFENNIVEFDSNYSSATKLLFYNSLKSNASFHIKNNKFYNNSPDNLNVIRIEESDKTYVISGNEFNNFNKNIIIGKSKNVIIESNLFNDYVEAINIENGADQINIINNTFNGSDKESFSINFAGNSSFINIKENKFNSLKKPIILKNSSLINIESNQFFTIQNPIEISSVSNVNSKINIKDNIYKNCEKAIKYGDNSPSTSQLNVENNLFENCDAAVLCEKSASYNNSLTVNNNTFKNIVKVLECSANAKINLLSFQGNTIDNSKLSFNLSEDFLNGFKNNTFLNGSTTTYDDKSIKLGVVNGQNSVIFDFKAIDYTYLCWVDIVSSTNNANRSKCLLRVSRNQVAPGSTTPYNNYVQIINQTRNGNWPLPVFTVDGNGLRASITGSSNSAFDVKVNIIDINGFLHPNEQSLGYSLTTAPGAKTTSDNVSDTYENTIEFDDFINASPNPVKDILKLESKSDIDDIKFYDLNGKLILHVVDAKNIKEINLSSLPSGLYIGIFQNSNSKTVKKIIKE